MRRLRAHLASTSGTWVLAMVIVLLPVMLAAIAVVAVRETQAQHEGEQARAAIIDAQRKQIDCINQWIKSYTARAEQVATLDHDRISALDKLARTLADASPAELRAAINAYIAASNRYTSWAPLPSVPRFTCASITVPTVPVPGPTATVHETVTKPAPAPTPGPTRTRTVTAHAAPVPPGSTVTRYVPGPTRTRTATATRTVAAPAPPARIITRPGPTRIVPGPVRTITVPLSAVTITVAPPCVLGVLFCHTTPEGTP